VAALGNEPFMHIYLLRGAVKDKLLPYLTIQEPYPFGSANEACFLMTAPLPLPGFLELMTVASGDKFMI